MCSKRIILTQTQILTLTCASCRIVSEEIRQKCMTKISTWFILHRFSASKGFECLRAATLKCWAPRCPLASVASLEVTLCLFSPQTEVDTQQCYPAEGGLLLRNTPGKLWWRKSAPPYWEWTPLCAQGCCHTSSPEAWGRPLISQINSGVIAELRVFHFTYIYFSNNLGTKDWFELRWTTRVSQLPFSSEADTSHYRYF